MFSVWPFLRQHRVGTFFVLMFKWAKVMMNAQCQGQKREARQEKKAHFEGGREESIDELEGLCHVYLWLQFKLKPYLKRYDFNKISSLAQR